ncbi:MAG TPA: transposase [Spirochaetia bacterium]|nr:transposase [Spirochaetia bacterium]
MKMQTITLKLKLLDPTNEKKAMYRLMADSTTELANGIVTIPKRERPETSGDIKYRNIPSAAVNQLIRDVRGNKKAKHFNRQWPGFNNQNLKLEKETSKEGKTVWKVSFPTLEKRVGVPVIVMKRQERYLEMIRDGYARQGVVRLIERHGDWYVHISLTLSQPESEPLKSKQEKIVGIDLGLICLLVAWCSGLTLFIHGAHLAYVRRRYAKLRWRLQKTDAHRALKRLDDKEHRWITDINHKIARLIVKFALMNGATLIRLEDLSGIRQRPHQSRKQRQDHGRTLHCWSFYQLRQLITYKAMLAGIRVELVNPAYTSKTCSRCGEVRSTRGNGRWFVCPRCKKKKHIDANAGENIAGAISGLADLSIAG